MTKQPDPAPERQESPQAEANSNQSHPDRNPEAEARGQLQVTSQTVVPPTREAPQMQVRRAWSESEFPKLWLLVGAVITLGLGWWLDSFLIGITGAIAALVFSLPRIAPPIRRSLQRLFTAQFCERLLGWGGFLIAIIGFLKYFGFYRTVDRWLEQIQWDEFGSWAEWVGAVGQISIAILAVFVAWRQYVISRDLTIQQNLITQQQTIDAYFQGISELALSDEGLLEDWPQERAFAEGRTAAILGSVDAKGRAKIIRFLSQSKLLTPLKRDEHLGRPILDGHGGYAEDRERGVRVIDLGVMLAGSNLALTDLRWTDLSEANLVHTNLSRSDLYRANLSRTVLYEANLAGADLKSSRWFYGDAKTASPRSRKFPPNYRTGAHTGAVVEGANFTGVQGLSNEQRYYCCAWCGEKSRSTIPGGCEGIPNKLGR